MKRILLILLMGMFLVSFVVAEEDPTFQVNQEFDLKRGCSNNGFFCDSSFICNATLIYPDGTILKDNVEMTHTNTYKNITVTQSQNNQLGFIKTLIGCNNVTWAGQEEFDIAITADGKKFQNIPIQLLIVAFGFILIGTGFVTERLRMFKHMGSILLMVMGVITLFPGYSFINHTTLVGLALGSIFIGIGGYFLIEGSFSRTRQDERFDQPQGEEEEEEK